MAEKPDSKDLQEQLALTQAQGAAGRSQLLDVRILELATAGLEGFEPGVGEEFEAQAEADRGETILAKELFERLDRAAGR